MNKKNLRVLVTCGPTWAPIDDVRVISNHSSGEMGHWIAQEFLSCKAKVTLIEGPVTHVWDGKSAKIIKYQYFDELQKILNVELKKNYDVIIHAAAVSDFKIAKTMQGKINSAKTFLLKLVPTPKLIDSIKKKAPKAILVGFKLEPDLTKNRIAKETQSLFTKSNCDLVVANSINKGYQGFIVDKKQNILAKTDTKKKLAKELVKIFNE